LDTPLKFYSSGMQLRLAFSVAAFLEPEIMVIDEVLAVGDAEFQKKCIGKMEDVNKLGRTILFVSHDMNAVMRLCKKTIMLKDGTINATGETSEIISGYLNSGKIGSSWEQKSSISTPHFSRITIEIKGQQPKLSLFIRFGIKCMADMQPSFVAFDISNKMGAKLGQAIPSLEPFITPGSNEKEYTAEINLPGLIPDDYYIGAWIGPHYLETYDWQQECVEFSVTESPQKGRTYPHAQVLGPVVPLSRIIE
jgi:lipopolysaccharide transport system ATP-binding protein